MRGVLGAIALGAALMGPAATARAEWRTFDREDPFAKKTYHMVMAVGDNDATIGFKCSSADDVSMIFVLPERAPSEADMIVVTLVVIVDAQESAEYSGMLGASQIGNLRVEAEDNGLPDLMREIAAAKKRVAFAIRIGGEGARTFHRNITSVAGARPALTKIMTACNVPLAPPKPS